MSAPDTQDLLRALAGVLLERELRGITHPSPTVDAPVKVVGLMDGRVTVVYAGHLWSLRVAWERALGGET